jgi:hypothetical protein
MKLRLIAIVSTTLLVSGISIVLISNPAQSARPAPKVTTTYSFYMAPETTRMQWTKRDPFDCYEPECEVTVTDPYGPALKRAGITFVNRVSNLPTGWSVCSDPDAYTSLREYLNVGFTNTGSFRVPINEWSIFGLHVFAGDSGYIPGENFYEESAAWMYEVNNSTRPKYQGYVLICGPDSSTPSGTVWKVVLGPVITLPAPKNWR